MSLPVLTTWTNFADVVANTVEGQKLLSASNYSEFETLVENLAKSNGYSFGGETLVKTGAQVTEFGESANVMTYTAYTTEGLTGGVATATEVATLAETETGITATTIGASAGAVGVGAIVGSVISGLGLGLLAYELTPEFWTGVSNAIFGTDIHYDNIKDYSIMTLFKDGKTYVPDSVVQKVNDYLRSIGAFDTKTQTIINTDNLVLKQTCPITYSKPYTQTDMMNTLNTLYSYSNVDFSLYVDVRLIVNELFEYLKNYFPVGNVNYGAFNIENYDYVNVNISIEKVTFPTDVHHTIFDFTFANGVEGNHTCYVNSVKQNSLNNNYYEVKIPTTVGTIKSCSVSVAYNTAGETKYGINSYSTGSTLNYIYSIIGTKYAIGSISASNINATTVVNPMYKGLYGQQLSVLPTLNTPLNTTFPTWYQNALNIGTVKPDKSGIQQSQFLPLELPSINPLTTDLTIPQTQAQLGDVTTTKQQQDILDALQRLQDSIPDYPVIQNPPSTDIGNSPTPPTGLISGTANGLMSIHNPTLSELNALGGYLWSSDIIDQILKLFQNPMDAIIGLHILYGTPSVSGRDIIKAGYLSTGVESNIVDNQYITIDCGTIQVPENSGNATDYPPFTRTSLYLPFIGIVELNAYDIIGSSVNIEYKIDVLTGSCLANVNINKNSSNAILYTYNGNCAVQLPLTGGNYASMISGLIGIGLGAMTGGVGMAVAGVMGAVSQGATVQHSGSIGSNSGAMGIKKPYLIVTRFIPFDAVNYNNYYGYPSNITCKISELSGFTKVKDIRLHSISATNKEKTELEMILKNGVIF